MLQNRIRPVHLVLGTALLAGLGAWSGCANQAGPSTAPGKASANVQANSLYQRLGGAPAVRQMVDYWVDSVAKDPRIDQRFSQTNLAAFKQRLTAQIGELTGGPEIYLGKDMRTAHKGMNISDAEWHAFMEDLGTALTALHVPTVEHQELLVKLEPMRRDVVGK